MKAATVKFVAYSARRVQCVFHAGNFKVALLIASFIIGTNHKHEDDLISRSDLRHYFALFRIHQCFLRKI